MDGRLPASGSQIAAVLKRAGWFLSGMAALGVCLLLRSYVPARSADAKPPAGKANTGQVTKASANERLPNGAPVGNAAMAPKKNPVASLVNNEPITREDLGRECLLHYGNDVLESMVNRTLILSTCQKRGVVITEKQINDEIEHMAAKFKQSKEQWLKMLEKERGIKSVRYANDIIWPTLALRELAKGQLSVTQKELDEAYESEFGPAVKVRLIAIENAEKAKQIHAMALKKPEDFPALAKNHSDDTNSASAYGLIQPIRHKAGDSKLEQAAFALEKGQISDVLPVGEMFVFIKCEEHIPAAKGVDRAKYDPLLTEALKDRKLRDAASDIFKELQESAKIENIYNDPQRSQQMPGVAAIINGQKITVRDLAEECIDRHGSDVLEGMINRKLIDQAIRKRNIKVVDQDLDDEIRRAAISMGKVTKDGEADLEAWLAYITRGERITREVYLHDEVWPSTALKKLVGDQVEITKEDLQRGFEANYGPKVKYRAIVLNSQKKAQEVWEKARATMTAKNFGDLAEQYSIETGSRTLRGEVPPIQKHGGQKIMEDEAFSLSKENPLSGIVQVGNTFVILFYEGRTKPINTSFDEVRDFIYRDIHEKKQRLAMAKAFDKLKDDAHVDNFVTGNVKMPKRDPKLDNVDPAIKLPTVLPRVQGKAPPRPASPKAATSAD